MSIGDAFVKVLCEHPDDDAIVKEDGDVLTYAEVGRLSQKGGAHIARHLAHTTTTTTTPCIAIGVQDGPLLPLTMLACWRSHIPFVALDARWPLKRIQYLKETLNVSAIICLEDFPDVPGLARIDAEEVFEGEAVSSPGVGHCVSHYVATSGTTGEAKVVETRQVELLEAVAAKVEEEGLSRGCRVLLASHLTFDPCQVDAAAALLSGAALVVASRASLTSWQLGDVLVSRAVTHLCCTPTHWRLVSKQPSDLPALRCLTLGGEPFSPSIAEAWSHVACRNTYGLTEGTGYQSSVIVNPASPGNIGRGFGTYKLSVVDGEVCIAGPGLSRYHGGPEVSVLKTGDLGEETEEGIVLKGRKDGMVKVRGQRVSLEEVEAVLRGCLIVQDAVACVEDGSVGACVATRRKYSRHIAVAALELHCRSILAPFAVPVRFAVVDRPSAIPVANGSGKVDRTQIQSIVAEQHERHMVRLQILPLLTPMQALVAEAWSKTLGRTAGRQHNFAHLGGDSISALRICNYVKNATHLSDPSRFDKITAFKDVASMLIKAEAPEESVCELGEVMGPYAPCELIARPVLETYAAYLTENGVVPNAAQTTEEGTVDATPDPLVMYCCRHNDLPLLCTALDAGAVVATQCAWGPVHEAAAHSEVDIVEKLLTAVDVKTVSSALHVAAARGKACHLSLLLREGADPSCLDADQQTILHLASRGGHQACVEAVLGHIRSAGVLDHKDSEGKTALSWAIANGHHDVAVYLAEQGLEPLTALERSALEPPEESFGRVKKKSRGVRAVANRKVERGEGRLLELVETVRKGPEHESFMEALVELRDISCGLRKHRLKLTAMGLHNSLAMYLWPPGDVAAQAARTVRNLANETSNRQLFIDSGFVALLSRLLQEGHGSEASWKAAGALGQLSGSPACWDEMISSGAAAAVLRLGGKKLGLPDGIVERLGPDVEIRGKRQKEEKKEEDLVVERRKRTTNE